MLILEARRVGEGLALSQDGEVLVSYVLRGLSIKKKGTLRLCKPSLDQVKARVKVGLQVRIGAKPSTHRVRSAWSGYHVLSGPPDAPERQLRVLLSEASGSMDQERSHPITHRARIDRGICAFE